MKPDEFSTILTENYYEIIKELATAILLIEGLKAVGDYSHKELLEYLSNYGFSQFEINIMDDLRSKRNKSQYEGKQIEKDYLENKKEFFNKIILKLEETLNKKLKGLK